ncbi:hypothetical protein [Persephonella sp. KM09-Lau-8]|uniref:hypothetical protein n=1 Tax=Persephonella sp. KM09-Lau-8 TaxID=1158345 RepID=UPI00049769E9|nr:hypothetical protein [Persephonella sp. KM09-Lau-8]
MAVKETLQLEISGKNIQKPLLLATLFTGTKEETFKELFKDIIISVLPNKEIGVIKATTGREYIKISFKIEEPVDEKIDIRIGADQVKRLSSILENFKLEVNEKNYIVKSKKTKINLAKLPPQPLIEQMEFLNVKESESQKITKIEGQKLYDLLKNIYTIAEQDPIRITFAKQNITVQSVNSAKSLACINEEPLPCKKETTIFLPKTSTQKILTFAKAFKEKNIEILLSKDNTKLILMSPISMLIVFLEAEGTPDASSLAKSIDAQQDETIIAKAKDIMKAIELIKTVDPSATVTTEIQIENGKIKMKTVGSEIGIVEEEIEVIQQNNQKLELYFSPKLLEKSITTITENLEENIIIKIKDIKEKGGIFLVSKEENEDLKTIFAGITR